MQNGLFLSPPLISLLPRLLSLTSAHSRPVWPAVGRPGIVRAGLRVSRLALRGYWRQGCCSHADTTVEQVAGTGVGRGAPVRAGPPCLQPGEPGPLSPAPSRSASHKAAPRPPGRGHGATSVLPENASAEASSPRKSQRLPGWGGGSLETAGPGVLLAEQLLAGGLRISVCFLLCH